MKKKFIAVLYCILQAAVGVVTLLKPIGFTAIVIMSLGAALTVMGIIGVVKYFKIPAEIAAKGHLLTRSLLMITFGLFLIFGIKWLIATFPLITVIYGIIMLIIGVSKIQLVADAIRLKERRWYLGIISAVITLACAAVVIANPFATTKILWMFTGISIIVDAVFDLVAIIFVKENAGAPEQNAQPAAAVEVPTQARHDEAE